MGSLRGCIGGVVLAVVASFAIPAAMAEAEQRQRLALPDVPCAVGIGAEVTHGDYGVNADATVVTVPLLVLLNPTPAVDLSLELPLLYLSNRSGSGMVVTQGGGVGQRRGNGTGNGAGTGTGGRKVSRQISEAGLGDISLTAGWTLREEGDWLPRIRPMLYLKAPTGDDGRGLGTGTFEGGPGLSLAKWLGRFQLFAESSYLFQDHTATYRGLDYLSYSGGVGLQATDRLFVSTYLKGMSARVEGGAHPLEGRLRCNFLQSRRVAWEVYGLAGFTDASPAAGGGLLMIYQF